VSEFKSVLLCALVEVLCTHAEPSCSKYRDFMLNHYAQNNVMLEMQKCSYTWSKKCSYV